MNTTRAVLSNLIRYDDHGTQRDIAYQLATSETFVPYMDPVQTWQFRAYIWFVPFTRSVAG